MTENKCSICNQPFDADEWCSEFCAQTTAEQKQVFLNNPKPGDYISYPCAACGGWVEDAYEPGGFCGDYYCMYQRQKADLATAKRILGELMNCVNPTEVPPILLTQIMAFVNK